MRKQQVLALICAATWIVGGDCGGVPDIETVEKVDVEIEMDVDVDPSGDPGSGGSDPAFDPSILADNMGEGGAL